MPIDARFRLALALALTAASRPALAADLVARLAPGAPEVVFRSGVDGCAPIDIPDINARAFRAADGSVAMFALHYVNRALRGPSLSHLKIDCAVALDSSLDPDPAHYNDRRYLAATWTNDGARVAALAHQEYHADEHGRCAVATTLGCWYNSIIAFSSRDAGRSFTKDRPAVVASAPFPQSEQQGRHRGFFNPSNIFSDGRYEYVFAATTGWDGQPYGACLFRASDPFDSADWRAWDGARYSISYADPYVDASTQPKPCAPIGPFGLPVGAVARSKSGRWLAVWTATGGAGAEPVAGFYTASSSDLLHWTAPKLLLAGKVILDPGCGGAAIAYPSILDETEGGRNFDHMGDAPWLYYTSIVMNGCETGARALTRRRLSIASEARS